MTTAARAKELQGTVGPGFEPVAEPLGEWVAADPTFAGTLCVYHHGRPVLDLWWGPRASSDELLPVFSSSTSGHWASASVLGCGRT